MSRRKRHDRLDAPVPPTPEQLARHRYEQVRGDVGEQDTALRDTRTLRRVDGSMLDLLRHHGHLTVRQWAAGRRLWEDWYSAGLEQHVTGSYDPDSGGDRRRGGRDLMATERQVAAWQRYTAAMQAVGQRHTAVLIAVACEEMPPSAWAVSALGKGRRSAQAIGLDRLCVSLDMLADHYGMGDDV